MPRSTLLTPTQAATVIAPRCSSVRACGCGQDLDTCRAEHCPRCGVTLRP